ncbi:MAG: MBL fold metallo-hydrolase [Actinomycetota bacterium]
MDRQIPLDPTSRADNPRQDRFRDDDTHEVTPDLAYQRLALVNVVFYGTPGAGDRQSVLIDAGLIGTGGLIAGAAGKRFGANSRPGAIVMRHGHFDHVGALKELGDRWDSPIYAHELELPYLDGRTAYPPPDPSVGGGLVAGLCRFFPRGPVDVSEHLHALAGDGSLPGMPGWCWLHTPGHTPGHVSLWREAAGVIIAGDAFITTRQESAYAVLTQEPEIHGPPMYFTPDWDAARASVMRLASLEPEIVVTGHGRPMRGAAMREALHTLARDFDQIAVPERGRYVRDAA